MRELNPGTKKHTTVICLDEAGAGGACHDYAVLITEDFNQMMDGQDTAELLNLAFVNFQNGPIKENGVNGCHNEDLIAIVIDRLEHFQKGDCKCRENALALTKLEEALLWLRKRTIDREVRGVEGTSII